MEEESPLESVRVLMEILLKQQQQRLGRAETRWTMGASSLASVVLRPFRHRGLPKTRDLQHAPGFSHSEHRTSGTDSQVDFVGS